jgi:hypothetical protein
MNIELTAFVVCQIFLTAVAGAGMLGFATGLNAIITKEKGICHVVYVLVGAILGFSVSSIQTLEKIGWFGWIGLAGILSSGKFNAEIPGIAMSLSYLFSFLGKLSPWPLRFQ